MSCPPLLRKLFYLLLPLVGGGLVGFLTRSGMESYKTLQRPPLSPPGIVFPIAWTILYLLMGWASWRIVCRFGKRAPGMDWYWLQLGLNFLWPVLFFSLELRGAALVLLVILLGAAGRCAWLFSRQDRLAGWLLVPYLAWLGFATYLNLGVVWLNGIS